MLSESKSGRAGNGLRRPSPITSTFHIILFLSVKVVTSFSWRAVILFLRVQIYLNTLLNWKEVDGTLGRQVKTILYLTDNDIHDNLTTLARDHGWMVFKAPRVSPSGVPYLKDMYHHASQHLTGCIFYGFSNGDILFNGDLLGTLNAISKVIGRWINWDHSITWCFDLYHVRLNNVHFGTGILLQKYLRVLICSYFV